MVQWYPLSKEHVHGIGLLAGKGHISMVRTDVDFLVSITDRLAIATRSIRSGQGVPAHIFHVWGIPSTELITDV
jgi:hypothetical protein